MKPLMFVVALIVVAACSRADEAASDTTLPAMAPAPTTTPLDTGMKTDTARAGATTKSNP